MTWFSTMGSSGAASSSAASGAAGSAASGAATSAAGSGVAGTAMSAAPVSTAAPSVAPAATSMAPAASGGGMSGMFADLMKGYKGGVGDFIGNMEDGNHMQNLGYLIRVGERNKNGKGDPYGGEDPMQFYRSIYERAIR